MYRVLQRVVLPPLITQKKTKLIIFKMAQAHSKFQTFAFTLRPRDGVTDRQIEKFCTYLQRNADYYKVITEKTGNERHLHAAFVMKTPQTRSAVTVYLKRMYKDLDPDEMKVMLKGLKIWYNRDFLAYLDKGDNTVVIQENLPEAATLDALFPPPPTTIVPKKPFMHDTMERYEKLWKEHVPVHVLVNTENVRNFLMSMQFEKRIIGLLTDAQMCQHAKWFTRWMLKANTYVQPLAPYELEEGVDIHPKVYH